MKCEQCIYSPGFFTIIILIYTNFISFYILFGIELRTDKQTDELDYYIQYHNIYFKTLLHKKYLKLLMRFFSNIIYSML